MIAFLISERFLGSISESVSDCKLIALLISLLHADEKGHMLLGSEL